MVTGFFPMVLRLNFFFLFDVLEKEYTLIEFVCIVYENNVNKNNDNKKTKILKDGLAFSLTLDFSFSL